MERATLQRGATPKVHEDRRQTRACWGPYNAPGVGASTVHEGIWELLWGALCQSRTRLRFIWIAARSSPAQSRAALGRVWPMPLPYPEVHKSKGGRREKASKMKLGVNYVVLCLNHIQNRGKFWRSSCPGNGTPLNRDQWATVAVIEEHVRRRWNSEAPVSAEDMGRVASKVESTEELLGLLEEGVMERDRELGGNYQRPQKSSSLWFINFPAAGIQVRSLASATMCRLTLQSPSKLIG